MVIIWFRFGGIFQFKMREPQMCNVVGKIKLDAKNAKEFKEKINDEYRVNMYVIPLFSASFLRVFCYHMFQVISHNGFAYHLQDSR